MSNGKCVKASGADYRYTIQKGDSLSRIAKTTGTTVAGLRKANCLKQGQTIHPKQQLFIPEDANPQRLQQLRAQGHVSMSSAAYLRKHGYTRSTADVDGGRLTRTSEVGIQTEGGTALFLLMTETRGFQFGTDDQGNALPPVDFGIGFGFRIPLNF